MVMPPFLRRLFGVDACSQFTPQPIALTALSGAFSATVIIRYVFKQVLRRKSWGKPLAWELPRRPSEEIDQTLRSVFGAEGLRSTVSRWYAIV